MIRRLHGDDILLRGALKMPSAQSLERGRRFFARQAQECRALAGKFPEMMSAAEKFERWTVLPDEELANHWPLGRAEMLRRRAVRAEMKSTQREHGRCPECSK